MAGDETDPDDLEEPLEDVEDDDLDVEDLEVDDLEDADDIDDDVDDVIDDVVDDDDTETPDEESDEALDELEAEELALIDDETEEAMLVDEAAELRAIRREELTLNVDAQGKGVGEFVCASCFLVKKTTQLANRRKLICFDCAS